MARSSIPVHHGGSVAEALSEKGSTDPTYRMEAHMPIWNSASTWEELSSGATLFRGFPTRSVDEIIIFGSPVDRVPVNMPPTVQMEIDNWFESRFGVRFRQRATFSTGSFQVAREYAKHTGEVREGLHNHR